MPYRELYCNAEDAIERERIAAATERRWDAVIADLYGQLGYRVSWPHSPMRGLEIRDGLPNLRFDHWFGFVMVPGGL